MRVAPRARRPAPRPAPSRPAPVAPRPAPRVAQPAHAHRLAEPALCSQPPPPRYLVITPMLPASAATASQVLPRSHVT